MVAVFLSAISMVVVPRGVPVRLTRIVFRGMRRLFSVRTRFAKTYEARDHALALYAPMTLIVIPVVWLTIVLLGYAAIYWGLGTHPVRSAITTSGSSLLTLGFSAVHDMPTILVAFTEAVCGLILLALLITYLPSMYSAFSKREAQVGLIATFAGQPPTATELIERFWRLSDLEHLEATVWTPWTAWFVELEETHTSLSALPFFRSPRPDRSWVTAAGVVLDAGALMSSAVDSPRSPPAELCIRSGYTALRTIADFFDIRHDPSPRRDDPIAVTRDEFDAACHRLAEAGVPLRADREQAWRDFAGWRVNYDTVLIGLAGFLMVPYAPWSSDRSPTRLHRPPVRKRHQTSAAQNSAREAWGTLAGEDLSGLNEAVIEEFRANGGRLGGQFEGTPMLLIHSTGARSGVERINPVMYRADGDRFIVFATRAGADRHPDWFHNLIANPQTTVEVGTETLAVTAREAGGEERARLWSRQKAEWPGFAEYEERTQRVIPVVILEPTPMTRPPTTRPR